MSNLGEALRVAIPRLGAVRPQTLHPDLLGPTARRPDGTPAVRRFAPNLSGPLDLGASSTTSPLERADRPSPGRRAGGRLAGDAPSRQGINTGHRGWSRRHALVVAAKPRYHGRVSKTSVEVDQDIVRQAAAILGTRTLRETIDAALRDVVNAKRRLELIALLSEEGRFDFDAAAAAWGADG